MYTRTKEYIKSDDVDIIRYVENINSIPDLANSTLLSRLDDCDELKDYEITKYEGRIDLISEDIYGDHKYSWILLYINRVGVGDLVRGRILKYIPIKYLKGIFDNV